MTPLEHSLLATLTWFDMDKQPLTAAECWYYLWRIPGESKQGSLSEVFVTLQGLEQQGLVKQELGFWQLAGSQPLFTLRQHRARLGIAKLRRAVAAAKFISHVPFVRLVAVGNTVALGTAEAESDIDLFMVIKAGRLFLGRFFVTALVHLRGWRRYGRLIRDRLCLSFYVSTKALNLAPLKCQDDPYLAVWVKNILPLVGQKTYQEFMQANVWLKYQFAHESLVADELTSMGLVAQPLPLRGVAWLEWLLRGSLGDGFERLVRGYELKRIRRHHSTRLDDGTTAVVVTDDVLKFHESDERPQLAQHFRQRLERVLG